MREGITITTGTVIGVGLFTTGANCVGIMGAGIILLTFIGLLICILPALMYAEMGAALPYAGGTYNYAKRAISLPVANLCMALSDGTDRMLLHRVAGVLQLLLLDL